MRKKLGGSVSRARKSKVTSGLEAVLPAGFRARALGSPRNFLTFFNTKS